MVSTHMHKNQRSSWHIPLLNSPRDLHSQAVMGRGGHQMIQQTRAQGASMDGEELRRILVQGRKALEANVEAINALNVFPVPDGDTGTNMLLTMKALEEEAAKSPDSNTSRMMATIARGALLGARGNSGVILAGFFQGLAKGLDGKERIASQGLASALAEATTAAYKAMGNPVEGTMLTVIREVSLAAQERATASADLFDLWEAICQAAKRAVAHTPELLPVLREAGVVDAGGLGLSVVLEGALKGLQGQDVEGIELTAPILEGIATAIQAVSEDFIAATEEDLYGYCTQFLIQGEQLDADAVRARMESMARSTVVVGSDTLVKVHVHTPDPGPVLSYAVALGTISQVSIVSMDEQHQEFVAARRREQEVRHVGILAVASGQGISNVFLDSGASAILAGGDTMNPSTREIMEAAEGIAAEHVIILPNNPNVVPAAEQAVSLSSRSIRVVPTRSIPQGIAAILAFNSQMDHNANGAAMEKASSSVVSGAVCAAARPTSIGGVTVKDGQFIGLLERQLVVAGDDPSSVLLDLVDKTRPKDGALVTLYWGADTNGDDAEKAAQELIRRFPGIEVEVVEGNQPYYNYIVSVE
ncbi:MAG: DAK2 domain-containing protein [Chloroflexi bacterium]|nr:DAK2 domain-containing protein [Chloroflexota bacterium]